MKLIRSVVLASALAALACAALAAQGRDPAVRVYYAENAMIEIVSPGGVRVLIDVCRPGRLSAPATATDILLTTHGHDDHFDYAFLQAFKGRQLHVEAGIIEQGDVRITGIPSGHSNDYLSGEKNGTNYLFLVETGGLRIVHMGDVGQTKLTDAQMAALGRIDVMITQFDNDYSRMSVENGKGFALAAQVDPALIIPTHSSDAALARQAKEYSCVSSPGGFAALEAGKLREARRAAGKSLLLIIGPDLERRASLCGAKSLEP